MLKNLDDYVFDKKLGKGTYGCVFLTRKANSKTLYATKIIDKDIALRPELKTYFLNEVKILKETDNENIIKLYELKETENKYFMIMEYCNGSTLSENLKKYFIKYSIPFPEIIVQYLLRQIASGLYYLNKCNIIHRDLKPENILLHYENEEDRKNLNILEAKIKIIDFGFAKYMSKNCAKSICGSPSIMDPIILKSLACETLDEPSYTFKADIWSLGVIVFHLLIGKNPFVASNCKDLFHKIDEGFYKIPKFLKLSKEAITLINGLLKFDSEERLSIDQLILHEFLSKNINDFEYIDLNLTDFENDNDIELNSKIDINKVFNKCKNVDKNVKLDELLTSSSKKASFINSLDNDMEKDFENFSNSHSIKDKVNFNNHKINNDPFNNDYKNNYNIMDKNYNNHIENLELNFTNSLSNLDDDKTNLNHNNKEYNNYNKANLLNIKKYESFDANKKSISNKELLNVKNKDLLLKENKLNLNTNHITNQLIYNNDDIIINKIQSRMSRHDNLDYNDTSNKSNNKFYYLDLINGKNDVNFGDFDEKAICKTKSFEPCIGAEKCLNLHKDIAKDSAENKSKVIYTNIAINYNCNLNFLDKINDKYRYTSKINRDYLSKCNQSNSNIMANNVSDLNSNINSYSNFNTILNVNPICMYEDLNNNIVKINNSETINNKIYLYKNYYKKVYMNYHPEVNFDSVNNCNLNPNNLHVNTIPMNNSKD